MWKSAQGLLNRKGVLSGLLAVQVACTAIFMADVISDIPDVMAGTYPLADLLPEILACLGLLIALVVQMHVLRQMTERQDRLQKGMEVARGALSGVMSSYFGDWQLTPAEQDVATFTIKGYSIGEIAALRGSAEGTVKTHLNAIYRKAGVTGRAQLVSVLVEDLLRGPLVEGGTTGDRQASADRLKAAE